MPPLRFEVLQKCLQMSIYAIEQWYRASRPNLDVVRFIQNHVIPPLPSECIGVLHHQLIRRDANMKTVQLRPAHSKILSRLAGAIVRQNFKHRTPETIPLVKRSKRNNESRSPFLEFGFPVDNTASGDDDEVRSPETSVHSQVCQQRYRLDCFTKSHFTEKT